MCSSSATGLSLGGPTNTSRTSDGNVLARLQHEYGFGSPITELAYALNVVGDELSCFLAGDSPKLTPSTSVGLDTCTRHAQGYDLFGTEIFTKQRFGSHGGYKAMAMTCDNHHHWKKKARCQDPRKAQHGAAAL